MTPQQAQFQAIGKMSQTTPQANIPQYHPQPQPPQQYAQVPRPPATTGGTAQYYQEKQALQKDNNTPQRVYR